MQILLTSEFDKWLSSESEKSRLQIAKRIVLIENDNYFGDHKSLGEGLLELRWRNGRRVYYSLIEKNGSFVILLLGGNKNGQKKDIKKARAILERET